MIKMKNIKSILIGLSVLIISSCSNTSYEEKTKTIIWPNGVIYEIFVQSFADSNGDGIGDIKGLTSKLDYLQDLGIKGIWLMPMSPSPSYHKYDVTDYDGIHPDYGTMDDFKHFVAEAHKRDIKIVIDFVLNHSSEEHPWFVDAKKGKSSPYRDYYVWANIDSIKDQLAKKVVTLDSDNITQWHSNGDDDEYYYGFFWKGMPDLNYDNPKVKSEMIQSGAFWLTEVGVDGLRLDAAKHIFPDEHAAKSHAWWIEFGEAMRSVKPDVYLVGEVWSTVDVVAPFLKGLPALFNFDLHFAFTDLLQNERNNGIIDSLIKNRELYKSIQPNFTDATFVNNHDGNRLINDVDFSLNKSKLAHAILLTLPGTPYVYYGDEIGMLGQKPDEMIREPFLWDTEGNDSMRTKWIAPDYSNDSTVIPLVQQLKNPKSTYSFFKAWINERNESQILREGDLVSLDLEKDILGYARSLANERIVVLHNLTEFEKEISLSNINCSKVQFYFGEDFKINDENLTLGPYQSVVLK